MYFLALWRDGENMTTLNLPNGYYELPKGKLANVATFLEMVARPDRELETLPAGYRLQKIDANDLAQYRAWYKAVGEDVMWFSRIIMADEKLYAQLAHPDVMSLSLMQGDQFCGLLELDFKIVDECELAFFGVVPTRVGTGLGRGLMDEALRLAFGRTIRRLIVHTCTFDHPAALPFYMRSGFKPISVSVEIHDDPRLTGHARRESSPQIPLLTTP